MNRLKVNDVLKLQLLIGKKTQHIYICVYIKRRIHLMLFLLHYILQILTLLHTKNK